MMSLSNTLNELGFNVKVSSASNIEDTSSLNFATFDFTADKQYHVFYAYGLKLNDELTNEEVTIKSNPNKSHVCKCINDPSRYKNAQEFVNSHIRLDHRIEIIDGGIFSDSMYSVLKKLIILNTMISIDSCVCNFSFFSFLENVRQTSETLKLPFGSGKKMISCSRIKQWLFEKISSSSYTTTTTTTTTTYISVFRLDVWLVASNC